MNAHGMSEYAAKMRGNLYERLVLEKLRGLSTSGMDVISFTMEAGGVKSALRCINIPVMQLDAKEYVALEDIDGADRVWIPKQSNFKSFDALLTASSSAVSMWLQITVGKTHPLHTVGAHVCIQRSKTLGLNSCIAFCVPPDVFKHWRENNSVQSFLTQKGKQAAVHRYLRNVKQIVICIPGDAIEEEIANTMKSSLCEA